MRLRARKGEVGPLEAYLTQARAHPAHELDGLRVGEEYLFSMIEELERYNLPEALMRGVTYNDPGAIQEMSLRVIERIVADRKNKAPGSRHYAMPDKLINWLVNYAIGALYRTGTTEIPPALVVLIGDRTVGERPAYDENSDARERDTMIAMLMGRSKAMGLKPSTREIAQEVGGVSHVKIAEMGKDAAFQASVNRWSDHYDAEGNFHLVPPSQREKFGARAAAYKESRRGKVP